MTRSGFKTSPWAQIRIKTYANRLAQYTYDLATLSCTDKELIADAAFTLYFTAAIENFSHAKTLFNELGSHERAKVCDMMIEKLAVS